MSDFDKSMLIGSKIKNVYMDEDKGYLVFGTSDGYLLFQGEDGCCGCSYVESIAGLCYLLNATIADVTTKEIQTKNDQCEVEVWGWTITTNKGICDIEFRYSGNYAGGMELMPFGKYLIQWCNEGVSLYTNALSSTDKGVKLREIKESFF